MSIKDFITVILPVAFTPFMISLAIGFTLGAKCPESIGQWFGLVSFLLLVGVVGIILGYRSGEVGEWLQARKKYIANRAVASQSRFWKFLEKDRAVELLLLALGFGFGLSSLTIGLVTNL